MNEADVRAVFGASSECPSIEVLALRLALPEGNNERSAAESHLSVCTHCRTELELLHTFERGEIRPDEAASVEWVTNRLKPARKAEPVHVGSRWRRLWSPGFALAFAGSAAAVLIAIGLSTQFGIRNESTRPLPEFGNEVARSRTIDVISSPDHFEWKAVPGAADYELTVRTVDDAVIFHNSFTATTLAFPPEVVAVERTGKLLQWEVVARDLRGNEIARSSVQQLRRSELRVR